MGAQALDAICFWLVVRVSSAEMNVYLARLGVSEIQDSPCARFEHLAAIDRVGIHHVMADEDGADLILFPQCHMLPTDPRLDAISQHPLARRHREKVMTYDERDKPWCAFPGVYVSMPRASFDSRYQRPWGYFPVPLTENGREPDLLFSFVGSPSDRCRKPLFRLRHPDAVVEEVRRFTFYDPSSPNFELRRDRFQDVLGRSRFVLCPRGRGTSSIRLYEALAAGRVPVIIADDWIAPPGADWDAFSIRWPEGQTEGLIEMVEDRDHSWPSMSAAAAAAHREYFAPDVWFHRVVEMYGELKEAEGAPPFPRSGLRGRAFITSELDFRKRLTLSAMRRVAKRILRRAALVARLVNRAHPS